MRQKETVSFENLETSITRVGHNLMASVPLTQHWTLDDHHLLFIFSTFFRFP
uniref:Uncharacterized protein n=1 Tax=Tetranychus urticae TaxID=32264 RepID=T1KSI9_TETUR